MALNFARSQKSAHRLISRWGGAGFLIRAGVKRPITCARADYKPSERGLYVDGAERIYISTVGITVEPDFELDMIQFNKKIYKITLPVVGPRPAGIVVFYDCSVLYSEPAT